MPDNTPALVVVAAGGLGTRVHGWARFIPKEFYPVGGRPGITRLLEEIAVLGPARVAIVYHPYYEQFAAWGRQVLSPCDHARYASAAGLEVPAGVPPGLAVSLIPQRGPYGDLTSVFNGADCLAARDSLYVAFADNLYPGGPPAAAAARRRRRRRRRARQQVPSGPRAGPGNPHHQPRCGRGTAAGKGSGRKAGLCAGQGTGRGARDREPAHAGGPCQADRAVHPVRPLPPARRAGERAEAGPGLWRIRTRSPGRGGSRRCRGRRPRCPGSPRSPRAFRAAGGCRSQVTAARHRVLAPSGRQRAPCSKPAPARVTGASRASAPRCPARGRTWRARSRWCRAPARRRRRAPRC
jgi:hypothetical protein